MRKIYSILLAMLLMPVVSFAANQAISKTLRTSASNTSDSRAYVDPSILKPVVQGDADFDYTIGAWINVSGYLAQSGSSIANKMVVFGYGGREHCNDNGCWNLCINNGGNLEITGWGAKGAAGAIAGTTVSTNAWHHVAVAYDHAAPSLTIYFDGTAIATKTMSGVHEWFTNENPAIYFASYGFGGLFDEAQIWNKALSTEEVAAAMVSAKKVDGLVGLYTFDENNGTAGTFANQSTQACAADNLCYFENVTASKTGNAWGNGLVYIISQGTAVTADPTFGEGRVVAYDVNLTIPAEVEGGTLTVTVNGTALAAGTHTIQSTDDVVVTATPNEGWNLVGVYAGETEIATGVAFTLTEDTEISAVFTNVSRVLTVANECGLAYILTNAQGDAVTLDAVAPGTTLRLVVTVPESHILNSVSLDGTALTLNRGYYEFTMPETDATLTINARAKAQYAVTIQQPEGGVVTVSANGTELTSGATVYEGTELSLAATSNAGFSFVNFLVDGNVYAATTLTPSADVTISAEFEEGVDYCVPTPATGSTTTANTTYGGRGINSWSITDGTNTISVTGSGTSSNRKVYTDATTQILTSEAGKTITITTSGSGTWMNTFIYVDYDLNGFTTSDKVFGNFTNGENPYAGTYTFTLPSDLAPGKYRVRYKVDWDDQDPCIYGQSGKDNGEVVMDFVIEIPKVVLETPRTVSVASANEALGTAAITLPKNAGESVTTDELTVQLTATAAENYSFLNWTSNGEVVSTENPYNYTGEADADFVANFGASLNIAVSENGKATFTVNGASAANDAVYALGSEVVISATPNAGKLVAFTVNGQVAETEGNELTITLEENTTISVDFVDFIAEMTYLVNGNGTVKCYTAIEGEDGWADLNTELLPGNKMPAESAGLWFYFFPAEDAELISVTLENGDEQTELVLDEDVYKPEDGGVYENDWCFPLERDAILGNVTISAVFTSDAQAINEIGIDPANGAVEYYNLQGVRVAAKDLNNGVYILRQGEKTAKVLIKK